jgi:GTPase-activator protein for Ras-like GTPase
LEGAREYFAAALRGPLLRLLADESLTLEVSPWKVYESLPESEKAHIGPFAPGDTVTSARMQLILRQARHRVAETVRDFLDGIINAVAALPYVVRWLTAVVLREGKDHGLSPPDVRQVVGDLVFMRLIVPAVISPELYGIVQATRISPHARKNLTLVAKILQSVARGTDFSEPSLKAVSTLLSDCSLDGFFEEVADVPPPSETLVHWDDDSPRSVIIRPSEVYALHRLLLEDATSQAPEVIQILRELPPPAFYSGGIGEPLLLIELRAHNAGPSVKSEGEVVVSPKRHEATVGRLTEALRLLSLAMPPGFSSGRSLQTAIADERSLATVSGDLSLVSKLDVCLRLLRAAPVELVENECDGLVRLLLLERQRREVYTQYLSHRLSAVALVTSRTQRTTSAIDSSRLSLLEYYEHVRLVNAMDKMAQNFSNTVVTLKTCDGILDRAEAVHTLIDHAIVHAEQVRQSACPPYFCNPRFCVECLRFYLYLLNLHTVLSRLRIRYTRVRLATMQRTHGSPGR